MNEYRNILDKFGCLYIDQLLTKDECDKALLKLFIAKENNEHFLDGMGLKFSFANAQLEYLLPKVQHTIETVLDTKLIPTYSYSRFYYKGDKLFFHTDANVCEVSISITLGYSGQSIWPLWILPIQETIKYNTFVDNGSPYSGYPIDISQSYHKTEKITIGVGSGVLYKGMEVAHGRHEYVDGDWQAQVFLHYVYADGKNKNYTRGTL